jgi:hypothetical protein
MLKAKGVDKLLVVDLALSKVFDASAYGFKLMSNAG